ncbi:VanW family protein [Nonomuraea sp. NPDC050547]|uniref:VanW family protein n=1 Tax=unclassified Nonomuraea TaxID=2593643 RepID=UPI0037B67C8D
MRRAGPIDSPTDPFASVPLPMPGKKPPKVEGLPPGVSRDIFGATGQPEPKPEPAAGGGLPPVAPPPTPWPMQEPQPPASFRPAEPPPRPPGFDPEPHRRRILPTLLLVLVVLGLLAYLVPAVVMSGSVLRGTRVAGIDIGGLTVTQAADKLRAELAARLDRPVTVSMGGREESIQPDEAGLELDVVATIGEAPSGFPTPAEVWRALTGTTDLQPKISIDAAQLARTVEGLAEAVDKAPKEGRVVFSGLRPRAVLPQDGLLLDRDAAVRAISTAFLRSQGDVALNMVPAKPETTEEAVRQAAARAKRAVAAPVTLTKDGKRAELTPAAIAAHLTFVPDGKGELKPQFDAEKALEPIEGELVDLAQRPADATYQIIDNRPVLVPARQGRGVDAGKLAEDLNRMLTQGGGRTLAVSLGAVKPRLSTADVSGLGIKENVATFTTLFDCCQARATNIQKMAQQLDGAMVLPRKTFSFNEAMGQPTAEAGYLEAPQVVGGRMVNVVGGGGSQFATTLYNAVFLGGFENGEHTPMDYHAPRYPEGRDVAVLYPRRDFTWVNNSQYGVLIKTASSPTSVTVTLWSTRRYDKVEAVVSDRREVTPFRRQSSSEAGCLPTVGQQGFTVDVTRVFYDNGKEVKRDKKMTTEYRPQAQVTCAARNDVE